MRFTIDQHFAASPEAVFAALIDPTLYASYPQRGTLARPEVLSCRTEAGTTELQLRHRFTGEVSSAVRAVVDPARLSWVEHLTLHRDRLEGTFQIRPDHYADRLRCSGSYLVTAEGSGARRRGQGELKVRAPLVAGAVERAITSGLQEHLQDESGFIDAFLGA